MEKLYMDVKKNDLGYYELKDEFRKKMDSFYKDEYYQKNHALYQTQGYTQEELQYKNYFYLQKEAVLKAWWGGVPDQRSMLDVGCGEGYALSYFDSHGWDVTGIDESVYGISQHNPNVMDRLIQGNFYDMSGEFRKSGRKYNFINCDNVLEHVPEPKDFMRLIKELCDRDTIICITVPNDFSIIQKISYDIGQIEDAFWVTKDTSEHLNYFTYGSLKRIGEATGFQYLTATADFPIDIFLLYEKSNYRKHDVGHECHLTSILLENVLFHDSVEKTIKLHEAMAVSGIGRVVSMYFKLGE